MNMRGIAWSSSLVCIAFVFVALAVYAPILGHDFTSWDDPGLITENPIVQEAGWRSIAQAFTTYDPELYIPLTLLSYKANALVCGDAPWCFHATNLGLHVANALLLASIASLLLSSNAVGIFLGLLFLLHPLNTEAVAWASARKDTLSTLFYLSSFLTYLHWRRRSDRRLRGLFFSLAFFVLGVLSKVMVVTLPAVLLLHDVLLERRKDLGRAVYEKLPFVAFSLVMVIVALFGKKEIVEHTSQAATVLMAFGSTAFYLRAFFAPVNLAVMHPLTSAISLFFAPFAWAVPLVLLLVSFACVSWKRAPVVAFGLLYFLLTLVPTFINFSKGGDIYLASDRYAYLPMFGLLLVLGFFATHWLTALPTHRRLQNRSHTLYVALSIVLVIFGFMARTQAAAWQDSRSLYERVLSVYPAAPAALNNLGMEYYYDGDPVSALSFIDRAIAVRRDARFLVNRGAALIALGRLDEAAKDLRDAINIAPIGFSDPQYQLGNLERQRGNFVVAIEWYQAALQINPTGRNILNNLGAAYLQHDRPADAMRIFQSLVQLHPAFASAWYNLGGALEQLEEFPQAEDAFRHAIDLQPDADNLAALARLRYREHAVDEAAQLLFQSLRIDPSNPSARDLVLQMKRDGVAE